MCYYYALLIRNNFYSIFAEIISRKRIQYKDQLAIPKLMSELGTSVKKCPN